MSSSLPFKALRSGDVADRKAAARSISEVATETPARVHGVLGRLADALDDDNEAVRRALASAIAEVAIDEPATIGPVAAPLVDSLNDESTAVRMGLARSLGELAAVEPQRLCFAIDRLVPSLTDTERVRGAIAWTLASLASRYPEALSDNVDELTRALLDDYHPVQQFVLRALIPLERTYPGLLDPVDDRLQDLVSADVAAVRQVACRAVVANRPPWAKSTLRERCRTDPSPLVCETARGGLQKLDAGRSDRIESTISGATDVFTAATLGTWVVLSARSSTDARFRVGRVTTITRETAAADEQAIEEHALRPEDFDTRLAWLAAPSIEPSGDRLAVHLHSPFRDDGINLLARPDGIAVEYTGPDGESHSLYRPDSVSTCSPDRARLLAARPADTLAFEIEGTTHRIVVTAATERDGAYRVVGENSERGYEITFRPTSTDPLMAIFEKGRAFRATNLHLTPPD